MSEREPRNTGAKLHIEGTAGRAQDGRMTFTVPYADATGVVVFRGLVAKTASLLQNSSLKNPVSSEQMASDLGVSNRGIRALVSGVREGLDRAGVAVAIGREKRQYFLITPKNLAGRDPRNARMEPTLKGELTSAEPGREEWTIDIDDLPLVAFDENLAKKSRRKKRHREQGPVPSGQRHAVEVYTAADQRPGTDPAVGVFQDALLSPHKRPGEVPTSQVVFPGGVPDKAARSEDIVSKLHLPERKGRPVTDATLKRHMRDWVNEIMDDPRFRMGATPLQMWEILGERTKGYMAVVGEAFELTAAGRHRVHEVVAILTYMYYGTRLNSEQQRNVVELADELTHNKRERQKGEK